MKQVKLTSLLLVLIMTLGFVSCDTEPVDPVFIENMPDEPVTGGGTFTVDIDGETFTAQASVAAIAEGIMTITGINNNGDSNISLLIGDIQEGTYDSALMTYTPSIAASDFSYLSYDDDGNSTGSITITSINTTNNTISGVFNFTGYWSNSEEEMVPVVLTNGTFTNIPYQGTITNPDGEYLKANIDGDDFSFNTLFAVTLGDKLSISGTIFSAQETLQLQMDQNIAPGTYTIGSNESGDAFASYNTPDYSFESVSGTLTIISNENGFIKGEFEFIADEFLDEAPSIEVVNGEFNIEL